MTALNYPMGRRLHGLMSLEKKAHRVAFQVLLLSISGSMTPKVSIPCEVLLLVYKEKQSDPVLCLVQCDSCHQKKCNTRRRDILCAEQRSASKWAEEFDACLEFKRKAMKDRLDANQTKKKVN